MKRALAAAALLFLGLSARAQTTSQEGNEGLRTLTLRFESSFPGNLPVTGNWQTADGTATAADNDYVPASGTWTIPQGQTQSNTISVQIAGDRKVESDEIFTIVASNVQGAQPPPPRAVTIINDDVAAVSVANGSAPEGDVGTRPLTFVITLTSPSDLPVDVSYFTSGGTATAEEDYDGQEGVVRFVPGVASQNVAISVIGDVAFEPDETFTLTATPTGGAPATATGTILNDDLRPAARLRMVSGNNQQGLLGQQLAQPLVVEALDEMGGPVASPEVEWTVTRGQATLRFTTRIDALSEVYVTPNSVGPIDVRASLGGLEPVIFTINASTSFESRARGPVAVPVGRALDTICASSQQGFDGACRALSGLSDEELTPALERVAPQQAGAEMKIAGEMVSAVAAGVAARLSAVRNGVDRFSVQQLALNVNGRAVPLGMIASAFQTDAGGIEESPYNGWSAFVSGNLGTGERDEQDGQLGFDLDARGLMFGADRLFGQTVFGASLNLMQIDADLSGDTGSVDTSGYALTVYGSRSFDAIHIDGAVTYGRNTYEAEHFAEAGGMELIDARSENDANVFAVTAGTGYEAHRGRTDFDFSLSGTWSRADIDDLTEEGSGPLILFVQGHEVKSLTATAGFNVRAAFEAPVGTILPSFRAEMLHEFEDGARFVTARFVRDSLGTSFTVPLDRVDRNYGRVGAGLQGVFPYGWSAAVEVMQDVLRDDLQFRNIQFTLYKSF